MRTKLFGLFVVGLAAISSPVHAQATSWLYAGGGVSLAKELQAASQADESGDITQELNTGAHRLLQVDMGLGVPANRSFVWGGLARMQLHGDLGIDLGLLARGTTGGFARGDFGIGLDIGVVHRWWTQRSTAATASVVLGGPWGLTLSAGASIPIGANKLRSKETSLNFSLGIDFARLTVHRTSGLNWFPNPLPGLPPTTD